MSTLNYNSTQVGVPYVRANNIVIQYPTNGVPVVTVEQSMAVKLADNSVIEVKPIQSISFSLDMIANATTAIPLVDPTSGVAFGPSTNLQQLMLGILAVVRQQQQLLNP